MKAGGDLSHSKLKGAVAPEEILAPLQAGRDKKNEELADFLDADPRDGFSVRNFQIQAAKMASISDVIVYQDSRTPREEAERLAKRIARAQTGWQRKTDGLFPGPRQYNTFVLSGKQLLDMISIALPADFDQTSTTSLRLIHQSSCLWTPRAVSPAPVQPTSFTMSGLR